MAHGAHCNGDVINTTDKAVTNDRLRMPGLQRPFPLQLLCLFSKPSDILITGKGRVSGINHRFEARTMLICTAHPTEGKGAGRTQGARPPASSGVDGFDIDHTLNGGCISEEQQAAHLICDDMFCKFLQVTQ